MVAAPPSSPRTLRTPSSSPWFLTVRRQTLDRPWLLSQKKDSAGHPLKKHSRSRSCLRGRSSKICMQTSTSCFAGIPLHQLSNTGTWILPHRISRQAPGCMHLYTLHSRPTKCPPRGNTSGREQLPNLALRNLPKATSPCPVFLQCCLDTLATTTASQLQAGARIPGLRRQVPRRTKTAPCATLCGSPWSRPCQARSCSGFRSLSLSLSLSLYSAGSSYQAQAAEYDRMQTAPAHPLAW